MLENKKTKIALNSVFWSLFLTVMKGVVGFITGSLGILSEALHSALDLGAALLTFFSVRVGDKPADKRHPYGHSKVESFSALIESALLFLTSGWIIYEAIKRLFFEEVEIEIAWYSFVVVIIAIVVDISRSRALMKVAKETNSQALEADALHFKSDIWSSGAVLLGLLCVYFRIPMADTLAALVVAVIVLRAAYSLSKRTFDVLIDAAPEGLEELVKEIATNTEGVIGVPRVRVRPAGAFLFAEASIEVSRKLSQEKAKKISKDVEEKIKARIKGADVIINILPITPSDETIVEQVQILAHSHGLSVHDVAIHLAGGKTHVSFDLEVPADSTVESAHSIASHLEGALLEELGSEVEIITHIEPIKSNALLGEKLEKKEEEKIVKELEIIAGQMQYIKNPHDVSARIVAGKIFISLHVDVGGEVLLEDAHEESSTFEYLVKQKIKDVSRVAIHIEPV